MSILGYSSAYFLPEYWSNTPLYGEKIIPLLDYILSSDFAEADKLANAFYNIENKYKNTGDLPIEQIEALIEESGYSYVKQLLGNDEDSIRLLVYLLVLIHQLKGTGMGIQVVLNLLRKDASEMVMQVVGNPTISASKEVSDFTIHDYVEYTGFTNDNEPFELEFQIRTADFNTEQCVASCSNKKFSLGVNTSGKIVLSLGNDGISWNIADRAESLNALLQNSTYYLRLSFTGYEYELAVSTDGKKYSNYISTASNSSISAHKSIIYLGVDNSSETAVNPFSGYINLAPFSVNVDNIVIQQWFEQTPVGPENTFLLKADLDVTLVSSSFFENFAYFVRRYVYPSLEAFEAKLAFENKLVFLPYIRQQVTYIASADLLEYEPFKVKTEDDPTVWEDFLVKNELDESVYETYNTVEDNSN